MTDRQAPAVAPFSQERRSPKCTICTQTDIADWIRACLIATKKASGHRPTAALVHREMHNAFPGRAPAHENSTRRHLRDHEDEFRNWTGDA